GEGVEPAKSNAGAQVEATGVASVGAALNASASPRGFAGKWWFWLPWPLLVALDLWSKAVVFGFLERELPLIREPQRQYTVFDRVLRFELVSWGNPGTIWGLFPNATVVLMVLRCLAVVGLFWFVYKTSRTARLQQFVLGLVLAGAIGNLYDNFVRADRTVRDFLRFSGKWPFEWDFPAFNVADSCITVGAIGLFLLLWREDRSDRAPQRPQ
ncbi:MAG: signal peptidase II, partial [Planctomycetota bacterium]